MGGELGVESEVGKGSKFSVRIPGVKLAEEGNGKRGIGNWEQGLFTNGNCHNCSQIANANLSSQLTTHNSPTHNSPRVLVVDDSSINREVLAALLAHAGVAAVDQACDGVEALSMLCAALEGGQGYDIVFTDLWMPNVNGIEFIEKLRGDPRFRSLPVYAVTADAEFLRDDRKNLFTGVLLKPLSYAKLLEVFQ